ncbi:MAG: hypothetical protein AAF267_23865, partial [Deinococcota bacterium]
MVMLRALAASAEGVGSGNVGAAGVAAAVVGVMVGIGLASALVVVAVVVVVPVVAVAVSSVPDVLGLVMSSLLVGCPKNASKPGCNHSGGMTNDPTYDVQLKLWQAYNPENFSEDTF